MATTRWIDNETKKLDDAINLLMADKQNENRGKNIYLENWKIKKSFEENKEIFLNRNSIVYNVIRCEYDQISKTEQPIEDIVLHKSIFIIVYYNGKSVNYIIDRNSDAQRILRILLSYSGKNEIEKNVFSFSNDFFIWIINKVYNSDNIIEPYNEDLPNIQLESIKGFTGSTEDRQTKVSATGESVMNLISTLSFLLESRRLMQVKLNLSYDTHENISLILKNETIAIETNPYQGIFEQEDEEDDILAKLYLLVYLEILPILDQEYRTDLFDEVWNKNKYIEFLKKVAENVTYKIEEKISILNEE